MEDEDAGSYEEYLASVREQMDRDRGAFTGEQPTSPAGEPYAWIQGQFCRVPVNERVYADLVAMDEWIEEHIWNDHGEPLGEVARRGLAYRMIQGDRVTITPTGILSTTTAELTPAERKKRWGRLVR